MNTLLHLKYHSRWRARRGVHGSGKKKRGANGEGVMIPVPIGTVAWRLIDSGEKEFVADVMNTQPVLVAAGGSGGLGNTSFVSAVHQEPVLAQKGEEGIDGIFLLELKLVADVGLIGFPNAGKSTLLSYCSAAKPKIAPYPFTTTEPVLGVVAAKYRTAVMMEVPGLIEGAQAGVGLGIQFLRHAERARLLLHMVDGLHDDPLADWEVINRELNAFSVSLANKPQFIVVNKIDIPEVRDRVSALTQLFGDAGLPLFFVSAATGEGVDTLVGKTMEALESLPSENLDLGPRNSNTLAPRTVESFEVIKEKGVYVVSAPEVERLLPLANLRDWKAMIQIWRELDRLGVVKALESKGVEPGDTVRLGSVELEWF